MLRAGGVLLAVATSRFASALDGIGRGLLGDPRFVSIVEQDEQRKQLMETVRAIESEPALVGASAHIMG